MKMELCNTVLPSSDCVTRTVISGMDLLAENDWSHVIFDSFRSNVPVKPRVRTSTILLATVGEKDIKVKKN